MTSAESRHAYGRTHVRRTPVATSARWTRTATVVNSAHCHRSSAMKYPAEVVWTGRLPVPQIVRVKRSAGATAAPTVLSAWPTSLERTSQAWVLAQAPLVARPNSAPWMSSVTWERAVLRAVQNAANRPRRCARTAGSPSADVTSEPMPTPALLRWRESVSASQANARRGQVHVSRCSLLILRQRAALTHS